MSDFQLRDWLKVPSAPATPEGRDETMTLSLLTSPLSLVTSAGKDRATRLVYIDSFSAHQIYYMHLAMLARFVSSSTSSIIAVIQLECLGGTMITFCMVTRLGAGTKTPPVCVVMSFHYLMAPLQWPPPYSHRLLHLLRR